MNTLWSISRVSSESQKKGEGPAVQQAGNKKFIASLPKYKDWKIVEENYDGSSIEPKFLEDRPDLMDILSKVQPGDVLAWWNMERLSRDSHVRSQLIQNLIHRKGIRFLIVSNKEYDLLNDSDLMMLGIQSAVTMKQTMESKMRMVQARENCRLRGEYGGGGVPYGYKIVRSGRTKSFALDEVKSKIYTQIVGLYEDGKSMADIAMYLNEKKAPTQGKVPYWRHEGILAILKNEFYQGVVRDHRTGRVLNDKVIPKLISKERWGKLQNLISKRVTRGPAKAFFSMLRGLCECGRCGGGVIQRYEKQKRKNGEIYEFKKYKCINRYIAKCLKPRFKECALPLIPVEELEAIVWNRTCWEIITLDGMEKELRKKIGNEEDHEKIQAQISEHEAFIRQKEQGCKSLLDIVQNGGMPLEEYYRREFANKAVISERQSVVEALKDRLSQGSRLESTITTLKEVGKLLKEDMRKYDQKAKRLLLQRVINKVVVDYVGVPTKGWSYKFNRDDWSVYISYSFNINELKRLAESLDEHIRFNVHSNL